MLQNGMSCDPQVCGVGLVPSARAMSDAEGVAFRHATAADLFSCWQVFRQILPAAFFGQALSQR
jgi:hypothetical protein